MPTPAPIAASDGLEDRLDQSLGFLLRRAHRVFVRALARELAPHGISAAEWSVLRVLWHQEGLTQVELADRVNVEKASLTGILGRLQEKRLLRRVGGTTDRRKTHLFLTQGGAALKHKLLPCGVAVNARAAEAIGQRDVAAVRDALLRLTASLDEPDRQ